MPSGKIIEFYNYPILVVQMFFNREINDSFNFFLQIFPDLHTPSGNTIVLCLYINSVYVIIRIHEWPGNLIVISFWIVFNI